MIDRVRKGIDIIFGLISGVFFSVAVLATLIGIVDRTFGLNWKAVWAEEVTRYSIIWSMFLIVGLCLRKGYQTAFTLFLDKMPVKAKTLTQILSYVLITLFCVLLFFFGLKSSILNYGQRSPVLQIRMFYPYMAVPVGSFLVLIETFTGMYEFVRSLLGYGNDCGGVK